MLKRNLVSRCVVLAMLAGSITLASNAQAKNDFEALLADINFGATPSEPDPAPSPSAVITEELSAAPADVPMTMPVSTEAELPAASAVEAVSAQEVMPAVPQPIADPASVAAVPVADAGCASCSTGCEGSCGHCGNNCGKKGCGMMKDVFCQPYTVPNWPTSTFYQYWRSNACNTQVWDGFRNRCHKRLDLSCKHGNSCGNGHCGNGCSSGHCGSGHCGPAPSGWCKSGCDNCDGQ